MHVKNRAFAALLLGMLMAQLDGTALSAGLRSLDAELAAGPAIAGVNAAYALTVTVSTPVHGRLGDLVGRRRMVLCSLLLFALASAACAAAPGIGWLIAARAVQGVGGSGLIVGAISGLGELFTKTELVRRAGWQTAVFSIAALGGPPVGGALAAGPGWRWIFLLNLPICLLAVVLGAGSLPGRRVTGERPGFDVLGAALVAVAGSAAVALGTVGALARSPLWTPVLVAAGVAAGAGFAVRQRRAASPLIPPRVFANRAVSRSVLVTAMAGSALFPMITFGGLAAGEGGPAAAGALLLAMTVGQLAVSLSFAVLARRWPAMAAWGRLGCATGVVGMAALAVAPQAGGTGRTVLLAAGLALAGAAFGLTASAYTLLVQSSAPRDRVGTALGALTFARQGGGALGIAVFGWLALVVTGSLDDAGLTVVFAAGALVMAVAWWRAPTRAQEAAGETLVTPVTSAGAASSSS
ncbi:MFS transporter [Amycolatopsis sp. CA-230715]|uniref:MFS transporter n=1 Tax=Amycolatopsis sp. CA-230715 TaxID=2745196 RepID=UPI001C03137F|nr:MFS transporter [Amycolatopsis sp. CA-230715]QWF77288.1 Multidrug resistance protein 3 [Amycolatopsis sp. CA-230715]